MCTHRPCHVDWGKKLGILEPPKTWRVQTRGNNPGPGCSKAG